MGGTKTARLACLPLVVCAIAAAVTDAHAQIRRSAAATTPIVESDGVRAGTTVRAALVIRLPEGFHVQAIRGDRAAGLCHSQAPCRGARPTGFP